MASKITAGAGSGSTGACIKKSAFCKAGFILGIKPRKRILLFIL